MGHALGGAIAEILYDRGLGAAGAAIDAVAVSGILATSGSMDRAAPAAHRRRHRRARDLFIELGVRQGPGRPPRLSD
jgi:hypothetical protein